MGRCPAEYSAVRHYDLDGEMRDGFVSSKLFPKDGLLGLYSNATSEWIQLDRKGNVLLREKVNLPEHGYGLRVAMSASGRMVIGGARWSRRTSGIRRGWFLSGGRTGKGWRSSARATGGSRWGTSR